MTAKTEEHKKPVLLGGIILIILVITGIIGLFYWYSTTMYVSTDDAAIDGGHVNISAKILGRIQSLLVDEGTKVEVGQLLVQLDDADLKAQENQAKAGLVSSQQNVNLAKVNLNKAQDDFDRSNAQFKGGFISKEQYDHTKSSLDAAKVQYSIALAQVNNTQAQLEVIETQLLNTKIAASIPGTIAKRSVMPGEVVQPGQTIFTINNLHQIWVTANFEETKIGKVHPNQPVTISVDAYPSCSIKGKVDQVSAAIAPPPFQISDSTKTTQKIPVKILFDQIPDSITLLPGMSVEVKIKVK